MPAEDRRRLSRLVKGPDVAPEERMRGRVIEPPRRNQATREVEQQRLF
jgi:hypothetical protein